MKTLVIYDISEDKKRTSLMEYLLDYGLNHIQYSGFLGEINPHDRFVLSKEVEKYLSSSRDSIYIIPVCDKCVRLCKIISENKREIEEEEVEIVD
ncbi:MAG: CRISPR-associated endonuclease Cas2 [Candidatus Bathyarchaeia archaeon]